MPEVDLTVMAELLQQSMAEGQTPRLTIVSESMRPLLQRSDQVSIEPVRYSQLQPGDIIVVQGGSRFLTHRYWGTFAHAEHTPLLKTRGDRSLASDPPWSPNSIVGRVISRHRHDQCMSLQTGPGSRLNTLLAWLSRWEQRMFFHGSGQPTPLGLAFQNNQRSITPRLVRRFFLTCALAATAIFTRLAALSIRKENMVKNQTVSPLVVAFLLALVLLFVRPAAASVQLSDFYAQSNSDRITLIWITGNELDNLGFHLWRGTDCDPANSTRITPGLIASLVGGQAMGATYEYDDFDVEPNIVYDYRLQSVDSNGGEECHQEFPVQAELGEGGGISTPGPGGGTSTAIPTSTALPTSTSLPSATPVDGTGATATSTPRPSVTAAPTNTPRSSPAPQGVTATAPATSAASPQPTSTPGGVEIDDESATTTIAEANLAAATEQGQVVLEASTIQETPDAAEAELDAAAGVIGEGETVTGGLEESQTNEADSPLTTLFTIILVAGLLLLASGAGIVFFLWKRQQSI